MIEFGPFKGRAYGALPVLFQFYLLTKITFLDPQLKSFLRLHESRIRRDIRRLSPHYIKTQLGIMEGIRTKYTNFNKATENIKDTGDARADSIPSISSGRLALPNGNVEIVKNGSGIVKLPNKEIQSKPLFPKSTSYK
jgi:hypothetical protein